MSKETVDPYSKEWIKREIKEKTAYMNFLEKDKEYLERSTSPDRFERYAMRGIETEIECTKRYMSCLNDMSF